MNNAEMLMVHGLQERVHELELEIANFELEKTEWMKHHESKSRGIIDKLESALNAATAGAVAAEEMLLCVDKLYKDALELLRGRDVKIAAMQPLIIRLSQCTIRADCPSWLVELSDAAKQVALASDAGKEQLNEGSDR